MMGSERGDYGSESIARLRERVAALQETLPLIRQNISEQFVAVRAYYDQRLAEQFASFDRQLSALDGKVSELAEEVHDLKRIVSARSLTPHDARMWWAFVVVGILVAGFTIVLIALWLQVGSLNMP